MKSKFRLFKTQMSNLNTIFRDYLSEFKKSSVQLESILKIIPYRYFTKEDFDETLKSMIEIKSMNKSAMVYLDHYIDEINDHDYSQILDELVRLNNLIADICESIKNKL